MGGKTKGVETPSLDPFPITGILSGITPSMPAQHRIILAFFIIGNIAAAEAALAASPLKSR